MDYQPGQQVLVIVKDPDKLAPQNLGPCQIHTVHVNGTVVIQRVPNTFECNNIYFTFWTRLPVSLAIEFENLPHYEQRYHQKQ